MLPRRATLPITPDPASTGFPSASSTTVSTTAFTVGPPFIAVWPACTTVMPFVPLSEAPIASVRTRFGKRAKNWSFTDGEKTAALLVRTSRDERS